MALGSPKLTSARPSEPLACPKPSSRPAIDAQTRTVEAVAVPTLDELLDQTLPLNRKERYYTGTVLAAAHREGLSPSGRS
jgi:hypothetical protein